MAKLDLSSKTIANEVFDSAPRGYDPLKVDQFLDRIVKDYELMEKGIILTKEEYEYLNRKCDDLEKQNKELEVENSLLKNKVNGLNNEHINDDNLTLLKRISALEKFIWNNGHNPDLIK